ncbi:hypothetical protein F5877DRAFT_63070 [Lentinula edodes]|nr:hypothetical protein F5877DRAFT_63070 [Lentinula edodes]
MSSRSSTCPKYLSLDSSLSDLTVHGEDDAEKGYMDPPQPRPHLRKKMNPPRHHAMDLSLCSSLQQKLRSEPISDSYAKFVVWEVFSEIDGYIITVWIIVLTLTTQRLALRRQLNLTNSVTAKHDANEAWMGVGVIYETPIHHAREFDDVPGNTCLHVNATYFDVTCGSLSGSVRDIGGAPAFVFADDFGLENTLFPGNINTFPYTISQNGLYLRTAPWGPLTMGLDATDPKYSWPSSILIFTTVPVFDSSNMAVEPVAILESMTYTPFDSQMNSTTTHVSALACNLTVDMSSTKADVNSINMHSNPEDALLAISCSNHKWSLLTYAAVSPLNQQLFMNCTTSGNSDLACGTLYESEQLFGGNGGTSEVFVVNENTQWIWGDGFIYATKTLSKIGVEIDSIGILQMIWLVSNHPEQKVITQITEPTTEILRKAGLEIEENYREW